MAIVFFYVKTSREMFLLVYSTEVTGTLTAHYDSLLLRDWVQFLSTYTSQDEWELKDAQIPAVSTGGVQLLSI